MDHRFSFYLSKATYACGLVDLKHCRFLSDFYDLENIGTTCGIDDVVDF